MAGEEAKKEEKPKAEPKPLGTFPGAPFRFPYWYPGFYSTSHQMAAYPRPFFVGVCPYHKPTGGQPTAAVYCCPYCFPVQQQPNQNININIGGSFAPSGCNTTCNHYPGYPTIIPHPGQAAARFAPINGVGACGSGQYQTAWLGVTAAQEEAMIDARCDNTAQDMQPSDPDPWRFYKVKELNGHFTSRNRFTIDSGEIGKIRWYQTPQGVFYAKVIPDTKA